MSTGEPAFTAHDLALSYVTERDIDLLLVEELTASDELATLVVRRAFPSTGEPFEVSLNHRQVLHSVTRDGEVRGETDIVLQLGSDPAQAVVLIENKIDAQF